MPGMPLKTGVQGGHAIRAVEVKITARVDDEDPVLAATSRSGPAAP